MATTINTGGRKKAEINMTPLIDVLLVLIIIFMVITPLTPRGVANARRSATPWRAPQFCVLAGQVGDFYKSGATRVIFVRGKKAIEFGRVAEVIDMARGAGVYQVALMTN